MLTDQRGEFARGVTEAIKADCTAIAKEGKVVRLADTLVASAVLMFNAQLLSRVSDDEQITRSQLAKAMSDEFNLLTELYGDGGAKSK